MKSSLKILTLTLALVCNLSFSQVYNVASQTKINDSNGNFNAVLESEDWFGYTVEGIGDLNNDGVPDLAVSSLKDNQGALNAGSVYILFLDSTGSVGSYTKIGNNSGGFSGVLEEWDIFGASISYLGDLDGDGKTEIAVGAEYDGDGGYRHGAIWILSLNNDGTVYSHQKISSVEGSFGGSLDVWDVFGTDIESLGDLNGDGHTDIAVAARRDGDGGLEKGAVWILFLNADFTVNNYQKISSTSGGFTGTLDIEDSFGGSICNIGDLNNDGVIDLAVGAYRDDDGGFNKGAVYILFLNSDGTVSSHQKISETVGGFTDTLSQFSHFGKSIANVMDINEDGKKEILVGSSGYVNGTNENAGSFYIINLNQDGTVDSFEKYATNLNGFNENLSVDNYFGFSVSSVGNLGGQLSLVVGAYGDSENGFQKGAVWVLKLVRVLSVMDIENKDDFKLFPNPTNTFFSIKTNSQDGFKINIFDVNGRLIKEMDKNIENVYDVSSLSDGTYFIQITMNTSNSISTFRLLKK